MDAVIEGRRKSWAAGRRSRHPLNLIKVEKHQVARSYPVPRAMDENRPVGRPGAWGHPDDAARLTHPVAVKAVGLFHAHTVPYAQLLSHV
jgi:hypothetical protein